MVTVTCANCGSAKSVYPANVKTRNFCNRACLGEYRSRILTGPKAAHWKGGVRGIHGRVEFHMPWHHRSARKGYVSRSIIVAELKLRRDLLPDEVVHHIDGDYTNDHPDNLEVYANQSEHARHHGRQRSPEMMAAMRAARENFHD
jgi:hypothetical protein